MSGVIAVESLGWVSQSEGSSIGESLSVIEGLVWAVLKVVWVDLGVNLDHSGGWVTVETLCWPWLRLGLSISESMSVIITHRPVWAMLKVLLVDILVFLLGEVVLLCHTSGFIAVETLCWPWLSESHTIDEGLSVVHSLVWAVLEVIWVDIHL